MQRHGLVRRHEPAIRYPVRLAVGTLDEMPTRALDPGWVDGRHHPRVEPRSLDETTGHDPLGRLGGERRARGDHEPHAPWTIIFALLVERSHRAQESREDRLVQV